MVESMTQEEASIYYRCAQVIDAREGLQKLKISDYPQLKEAGRKKIWNEFKQAASPADLRPTLSVDEFIRSRGLMGG